MGKKRGRPSKADADATANEATQSADLNGQNSEPAAEPAEASAPQPAETAEAEDVSTLKKKKSKKQKTVCRPPPNLDMTSLPDLACFLLLLFTSLTILQ